MTQKLGLDAAQPVEDIILLEAGETLPQYDHLVDALANSATCFILACGGDDRIETLAETGRNRYGTLSRPAPDEIWLSSSTASAPSESAFAAARQKLMLLMDGMDETDGHLTAWLQQVRERLLDLFGIPGAEAVLSSSGTEAEFLALLIAQSLLGGALSTIVTAPTETGSGVLTAAQGRHFSRSATYQPSVVIDSPLDGWDEADIAVKTVAIRDQEGALLAFENVDAAAEAQAAEALQAGRDVLLHVLDHSKTGHARPSRVAAKRIAEQADSRAIVVVDACQLRCSSEQIRNDLRDGFMVMITGSKFAGGPAFSGALLIPPQLLARLSRITLPRGLSDYSARGDWPPSLAERLDGADVLHPTNIGMGLRWEAALHEMEAYDRLSQNDRDQVLFAFEGYVRKHVSQTAGLSLLDAEAEASPHNGQQPATIFAILTESGDAVQAYRIYRRLREPQMTGASDAERAILKRICHVGQPVRVGENKAALRVCASMPMVTAVCAKLGQGENLESAMADVAADLEATFQKWALLIRDDKKV